MVVGGGGGVPVVLQQPVEGRLGLVVAGRIAGEFGRVQADQIMHPPPVAADRLLGHEAGPGKRRQEGADLSGWGAGQRGGGLGGGIRARVKRQQPKQPRLLRGQAPVRGLERGPYRPRPATAVLAGQCRQPGRGVLQLGGHRGDRQPRIGLEDLGSDLQRQRQPAAQLGHLLQRGRLIAGPPVTGARTGQDLGDQVGRGRRRQDVEVDQAGRDRSQDIAGGHEQPVLTAGRDQRLDLRGDGGVVGDQQHRLPGIGQVSQLRLVPPGLLPGRRQIRIRHPELPQQLAQRLPGRELPVRVIAAQVHEQLTAGKPAVDDCRLIRGVQRQCCLTDPGQPGHHRRRRPRPPRIEQPQQLPNLAVPAHQASRARRQRSRRPRRGPAARRVNVLVPGDLGDPAVSGCPGPLGDPVTVGMAGHRATSRWCAGPRRPG